MIPRQPWLQSLAKYADTAKTFAKKNGTQKHIDFISNQSDILSVLPNSKMNIVRRRRAFSGEGMEGTGDGLVWAYMLFP